MEEAQRDCATTEYSSDDYVAVRMKGNCMRNAGIVDGSILTVRMQRRYEVGDVVLFVRIIKGRKKAMYLRRAKAIGGNILLVAEGEGDTMIPEEGDFVIGVVVEVKTIFKNEAA